MEIITGKQYSLKLIPWVAPVSQTLNLIRVYAQFSQLGG
jgi:hypothetical protein